MPQAPHLSSQVTTAIPIKRGLKEHDVVEPTGEGRIVTTAIPIKRGLKEHDGSSGYGRSITYASYNCYPD